MIEDLPQIEDPSGEEAEQTGEVIDTSARTRPRIHSADALDTKHEIEELIFLSDVPLRLNMILGEATMSLGEVIALESDSIVQLDKPSGDPVDIFLENQKLGTGEVIVLHERLRIRLLEVTSPFRGKEGERMQNPKIETSQSPRSEEERE